jgi:23S rRNA maturation mini-RNase III
MSATALEALFGWLWLRGKTGRLCQLFEVIADEKP